MTDDTQTTILPPARSFAQVLAELENGVLHQDLSEAIQQMVADLNDYRAENGGKPKGALTLKLELRLDGEQVDITADLAVKTPKQPRGRTTFYTTPENNLSRMHPRQRDMFIKDVTARGDVRTA